jgi:threonine/homoserine/homoserine lactone efflux protein
MLVMLDLLAAGFVLGLTHAVPPGPITVEVLRRGAAEGFVPALKADAGAVAADAVFFVLVMLGLIQVIGSPAGKVLVWACGCALLLFLGLRGIYRVMRKSDGASAGREQANSGLSPFMTGFLICISSPFAIVWWISVFTGSVALFDFSAGGMVAMFAGIALACLLWYALIGLSGSAGKKWFTPGAARALSLACSAMMIAFSGLMFYRGYVSLL